MLSLESFIQRVSQIQAPQSNYKLTLSLGLRVFATARQAESISDLSSLGIETLNLEVHKPESIKALRSIIQDRTGGALDMLVNNAGRNYTVPALEVDFEEVLDTFNINVFAVMRMCQEFAPLLIQAKGTIVQIGSLSGMIPHIFGSTYNASKAALHSYSNTMRLELAPFGVKVVTIMSGRVKSRLARTERKLPEDSLYLPVNDEYQKRATHGEDGCMSAEDFAKSVVSQVLVKTPKKWIWEGSNCWTVWFMDTFLSRETMVSKF